MNHAVAVDASVAVKWVVDEELSDRAHSLLADSLRVNRPVVGPTLLPAEVTNAIYQRVRRKDIPVTDAEAYLAKFLALPLELISPRGLVQAAFRFSHRHRLKSTYDSLYVELARMLQVELWTDDRTLLAGLESVAPWVRWIGDYRA